MMNSKRWMNKIESKQILKDSMLEKINNFCTNKTIADIIHVVNWVTDNWNIDITLDADIINGYLQDWSNIDGNAIGLCRPKNNVESAIILRIFYNLKIPYTISAGRTNLTGSATPLGGFVISIENLKNLKPRVENNHVISSPGIYLEDMRKEVLVQTNNKLCYPVDPTSRKEAMIGGTVSCNASGFVPGEQGATRYWVQGLEIILPNGTLVKSQRGDYISKDSTFELDGAIIELPTYERPNIKNASGPYTCGSGEIDFIDLIVGSEGLFGLITQCTFRLKPRPENHLDLLIILSSEKDAMQFYYYLNKILQIDKVTALEYFGYNCQSYMVNREYFFKEKSEVGIYLQVPLYKESFEEACKDWLDIVSKSECDISDEKIYVLNDQKSWNLFFEARHSMPELALKRTKELNGISIITDTIVPPENFSQFLEKTHSLIKGANIEYLLFGHLGDCHLHFHLIPNSKQEQEAISIYDSIIDISSNLKGVYSAEHGTGKRKKMDFAKCYGEDAVNQVRCSKLCFDPNMLVNRGNVIDYKS